MAQQSPASEPAATEPNAKKPADNPILSGFSWERVPLNIHFAKRSSKLTDTEVDFLVKHSGFICLEKSHGIRTHGSTEAGIADTAKRVTAIGPDAKVLFYFNAFINWQGYQAFESFSDQWLLRDTDGKVITHAASGTPRPDPSNAEFRDWWSDVVAKANQDAPLGGVFIDAIPQALSPGLGRQVGQEKAKQIVDGLREMIAMTKRKIGPDRVVLVNGIRGSKFREILDWEGVDGVMIEHFDIFQSTSPEAIKADLDSITLAATKGKFVVLKGWPGFSWLDKEMMRKPQTELLQLARKRITFPLACFLIAAEPGSHFCYSWGYTHSDGMLDAYQELDRPLGPPQGPAKWNGMTATRHFRDASVWIDLANKQARIDWSESPSKETE